jgi:hypothetical protein
VPDYDCKVTFNSEQEMADKTADVLAAARVLANAALQAIQDDPHQWSARPCPTCRAVSSLVGRPFGCYLYAQQRGKTL